MKCWIRIRIKVNVKSRIQLTLTRNRIDGSVTASKWKVGSGSVSASKWKVKSESASKWKEESGFALKWYGSATLDAPSAYWLLSEKSHSHWLNWRAGTSWASWAWRRGTPPSLPWVSWPGQAPASSHSHSHALKIFSGSNFMYVYNS